MKNVSKVILNITLIVFSIIYVYVFCVFGFLLINQNQYGLTEIGNRIYIDYNSNSMTDKYKKGSLVRIKKINIRELSKGEEIFLYQDTNDSNKKDILIADISEIHTNVTQPYIKLKNDSKEWNEEQIIGISDSVYNNLGFAFEAFTSNWTLLFIFFVPAIAIFIYEIHILRTQFKVNKKVKDNKDKENELKEKIKQVENNINDQNKEQPNNNSVDNIDFDDATFFKIPDIEISDINSVNAQPVLITDAAEEPSGTITIESVVKDDATDENKEVEKQEDETKKEEKESKDATQEKKTDGKAVVVGKGINNFVLKILELKKYEIFEVFTIINKVTHVDVPANTLKAAISSYVTDKYIQPIDYTKEDFANKEQILINKIPTYTARKKNLDKQQKEYITNLLYYYNELDGHLNNINALTDKYIHFDTDMDKEVIINCITEKEESYSKLRKVFIDKITATNMFKMLINDTVIPNVKNVQLQTNIRFSKIFSDYVIDKSYKESVVVENLEAVLLKLVGSILIKEIFEYNYTDKYIIHFNNTLYNKERKIKSVVNNFNDPFSQKKILVLIDNTCLNKNIKVLTSLKNKGYSFIVQLEKSILMDAKFDNNVLSLCEYIVVIGDMTESEKKALLPVSMINSVYCVKEAISSEVIKL